ncbi:excinuclease ABC subunit B [Candidatus Marinamargulisbacteria bacterium SCGC AG-343-D04]|nr:excinuclease ABC subunit B [Candidatus Marinamargulisbacteria bacterium SCGC AG-343-D04]
MTFKLESSLNPAGDQPFAIEKLSQGLIANKKNQLLMGVTGSGKTFTMAHIIANLNRPALIIAHNKTLAAQLCNEFKEIFPKNSVEYFISYYDYYQPEAYIPSRDAYIEKEAQINEEIERLRHKATRSLLLREDVIIVASVSCIYGLGVPEEYAKAAIMIEKGKSYKRRHLLRQLEANQYTRNDIELKPGYYRVKGDTIDIFPSWEENIYRCEFFGDECDRLRIIHPIKMTTLGEEDQFVIFPATHYVVNEDKRFAIGKIRNELEEQVRYFEKEGKVVEAQRIRQRTNYDLEMMEEVGYCKGIENYSRHLSNREKESAPGVLLDFFPDDFITFIDESHVTVPQISGMYKGDQSRKQSLVDYGFRLPSAKDNRPLNFGEFENKVDRCIYVSATPGEYECEVTLKKSAPSTVNSKWDRYECAEQIIRPTGLLDPIVEVRETEGQIDDILHEIKRRIKKKERILITTLTKLMAEDLCDFIQAQDIAVRYMHSEVKTLERIDILHHLRTGKIDVLVGVNLLREGLDLPEVSLVVILDADKEGFLRNERSLIQTIGRAARHKEGTVILYADRISKAMDVAIQETKRRRLIQEAYNKKNGIEPRSIIKKISDIRDETRKEIKKIDEKLEGMNAKSELTLIKELERQMQEAAENLEFEVAAVLRDKIKEMKSQNTRK